MSVAEHGLPAAEVEGRAPVPLAVHLHEFERHLDAVCACVRRDDGEITWRAAQWLLHSVERQLAELLRSPDVDAITADRLTSVRDRLSGFLLASRAIAEEGGSVTCRVELLRRAASSTQTGLDRAMVSR